MAYVKCENCSSFTSNRNGRCSNCGERVEQSCLTPDQQKGNYSNNPDMSNKVAKKASPNKPSSYQSIRCNECGDQTTDTKDYCSHCGNPLEANSRTYNRNKYLACFLALFLGAFGIHKFYLGKPGQGLLYAVFFWTFIPTVISFFEALAYLFMSQSTFDVTYNS